jgi:hypothetical protein
MVVFKTGGFKFAENQSSEVIIDEISVGSLEAKGVSYLPVWAVINSPCIRESGHCPKCELQFDYELGPGPFGEIYERFDPGALLVAPIFADLQSRSSYGPRLGSDCVGVYGFSMGIWSKIRAGILKELGLQVVQH